VQIATSKLGDGKPVKVRLTAKAQHRSVDPGPHCRLVKLTRKTVEEGLRITAGAQLWRIACSVCCLAWRLVSTRSVVGGAAIMVQSWCNHGAEFDVDNLGPMSASCVRVTSQFLLTSSRGPLATGTTSNPVRGCNPVQACCIPVGKAGLLQGCCWMALVLQLTISIGASPSLLLSTLTLRNQT
jgi:hypothetical protein